MPSTTSSNPARQAPQSARPNRRRRRGPSNSTPTSATGSAVGTTGQRRSAAAGAQTSTNTQRRPQNASRPQAASGSSQGRSEHAGGHTAARGGGRTRPNRGADRTEAPRADRTGKAPAVAGPHHTAPATAVANPDLTFAELGVPAGLLPALTALGAVHPFPIQSASLPSSMQGRDVLGRGRTGSGKTIAFALPLVHQLSGARSKAGRPRGLVLVPTRELALQVMRTVQPLAKAAGLTVATVFGGVGFGPQLDALRRGVDILVACPGRLEDLIKRGDANLSEVRVTVLDEADHMADLGFLPGVRRILRATPRDGQRLLFSATLDQGIGVLADDFLTDPATHEVDEVDTPVTDMEHHVLTIRADDRGQIIRELAAGQGRRILFARTKHGAKRWAQTLRKSGIEASELHGNLAQGARERNLAAFHDGSARVLVATDIAARGIHVDDVELVVHLEPPAEHKAYVHRSGRTARAGAGGTVVTLMLAEQANDVRKLLKAAGISAGSRPVRPGDPLLRRLAG